MADDPPRVRLDPTAGVNRYEEPERYAAIEAEQLEAERRLRDELQRRRAAEGDPPLNRV